MRCCAALACVLLLAGCGGGGESEASCDVTVVDEERAGEVEPLEDGDHTIEFQTTHGNFTVEIDEQVAPCNGGSMMQLARDGFFEGIAFHRIVPDFVIQAGQSEETQDGGPGYTTVDVPPAETKYTKGVVAMAKTQFDPPGTGSSQFFVVTGTNVTLPPEYAPIGKVVEGMDTVDKIGRLGNAQTQAPTEQIVIRRAIASG